MHEQIRSVVKELYGVGIKNKIVVNITGGGFQSLIWIIIFGNIYQAAPLNGACAYVKSWENWLVVLFEDVDVALVRKLYCQS